MHPMKNSLPKILLGLFSFAVCLNAPAQTPPKLKMTKDSPTTAQISWTNQIGKSYHVYFSTNLTKPFAFLEDAFSADLLVTVYASTADAPIGFFRIQVPTNAPTASVQLVAPSNSVTVRGEISVRMGAQLGTQIQGVNLYLDDVLVGYLNSGGMNFTLDTTHFANGAHTVYVGAVDTANNETLSSSTTLNFQNSVRWLDACALFNDFVPIDVTADFYPADWLVTVTDANGIIVRTIAGSTTDGNISTSWDGTDDNGQSLPVENLYQVQVDVTQTSTFNAMLAASLASSLSANSVTSTNNAHGVPEFTMSKSAPNPLAEYLQTLSVYRLLTPELKKIYPPLPARPANNPLATTKTKLSAREMFLALHQPQASTASPTAASPNGNGNAVLQSGSTKTLAWWENPWNSQQTIVARVPINSSLNHNVINLCGQIADFIGTTDGNVGNNRGMFDTQVQIIQTGGDVTQLKNNLNNPGVTALYFYGHGTASGNAFGTETTGIFASNLAALFGNYYYPVFKGKQALVTHKPFNFVFLDGCNTALGDLPEAFGIPKYISGAQLNEAGLHKRAFLGWTGPVVFQFDTSHINWSLKFWEVWIDGGLGDKTVIAAKLAADAYSPSVVNNVPIRVYGNNSLKYSN
jgi:hypothetical protein